MLQTQEAIVNPKVLAMIEAIQNYEQDVLGFSTIKELQHHILWIIFRE